MSGGPSIGSPITSNTMQPVTRQSDANMPSAAGTAGLGSSLARSEPSTSDSTTRPSQMMRTPSNTRLLPAFDMEEHGHLPTPRSPGNVKPYSSGVLATPPSPLAHANIFSANTLQRATDQSTSTTNASLFASRSQIMTPDSSPLVARVARQFMTPSPPAPGSRSQSLDLEDTPGARSVTPTRSEPASPPSASGVATSAPSSAPPPRSILASPFSGEPTSVANRTSRRSPSVSEPTQSGASNNPPNQPAAVNGNALAQPTPSFATSIPPTAIAERLAGGELERVRRRRAEEGLLRAYEAELRRPTYFRRSTLTTPGGPPIQGVGLHGMGIADTPTHGRRLKLFQETSEESFEASLMTRGYPVYGTTPEYGTIPYVPETLPRGTEMNQRTVEWLQQSTPGPATTSKARLDSDSIPDEQDSKKRKRLAAFEGPSKPAAHRSKLFPVFIEGKGRVLIDCLEEESSGDPDESPAAKRRRARRAKRAIANGHPVWKSHTLYPFNGVIEGPNWVDSSFPWSLRKEERAGEMQAEQEERMRCIARFLERDTDDEQESEEEFEILPLSRVGQVCEAPPMPNRSGRGKMVPLRADPYVPPPPKPKRGTPEPSHAFFLTDPGDAKAALLAKRAVRALRARHQRTRRLVREDTSDEVPCICNGEVDDIECVQCDGCQTWFHLRCMGIEDMDDLGGEDTPWYCESCIDAGRVSTPPATPPPHYRLMEPTLVPTDDGPILGTPHDPLFCPTSFQNSPSSSWPSSYPSSYGPHTPTQRGFYSGQSDQWNTDPSTPNSFSREGQLFSTPIIGKFTSPVMPPMTPSKSGKIGGPFVTPRFSNNLFSTPSKSGRFGQDSPSRFWNFDDSPIERSHRPKSPLAKKFKAKLDFQSRVLDAANATETGASAPQGGSEADMIDLTVEADV